MKYLINNIYITEESGYWYLKYLRNISVQNWLYLSRVINYCIEQYDENFSVNHEDYEIKFDTKESAERFINDYMEPYITMLVLVGEI